MTIELTDEREPSKMLPDEHRTEAENEAPKEQDAPLTKEMLSAQLHQLVERAKAAGLHPLRMMARAYVKQGAAILESFLRALEDEDTSKKKK